MTQAVNLSEKRRRPWGSSLFPFNHRRKPNCPSGSGLVLVLVLVLSPFWDTPPPLSPIECSLPNVRASSVDMEGSSAVPFLFLVLLPFLSLRPVAAGGEFIAAAGGGEGLPFAGRLKSDETGFISALITKKGLDFVRDLLVRQAVGALIPLHLRDIQKTLSVPFIGKVSVKLSNITLDYIEISSSTIQPGPSGVTIVASDATANISMEWYYSYTTWFFPLEISDSGNASVQVTALTFPKNSDDS